MKPALFSGKWICNFLVLGGFGVLCEGLRGFGGFGKLWTAFAMLQGGFKRLWGSFGMVLRSFGRLWRKHGMSLSRFVDQLFSDFLLLPQFHKT